MMNMFFSKVVETDGDAIELGYTIKTTGADGSIVHIV